MTVILYNFCFTNVRSLNVITAVLTHEVKKNKTKVIKPLTETVKAMTMVFTTGAIKQSTYKIHLVS